MNKKWVAVLAAMAVTAVAFAAKAKYPAYLIVRGTTVKGYTGGIPADLIIPDGVKEIDDEAFRDCTSLVSVTIPGSVKEIGDEAFRGCTSLREIQFKGTIAQWQAIQGSDRLKVMSIQCSDGYLGLKELPAYLEIEKLPGVRGGMEIYVMGYTNTVPANLVIPDGVTVIGYFEHEDGRGCAFSGCTALESVIIPASVKTINYWAFYECTSLKSVTIADGMTGIGERAFYGCTSLVSMTIPGSVKAIDKDVFSGCTSLKEIQFNGTRAQWQAVRGSDDVKIPGIRCSDGYIGIGAEAVPDYFKMDGTKITGYTGTLPANLVIPDGVTEIERGVLSGCFDIESVTIPGSVLADAQRSRIDDASYEMVRIKDKFTGMFSDCTYLERVTILDGAVRIPFYMFFNCTSLKSITIPDSMTTIAQGAFYNCASLKSIAIPQSVTAIGSAAFSDCASLTAVEIPAGVTEISYGVFGGCTLLASVTIPDGVTAIGERAFQDCASLKSVTIPRGVTKIGEQAFRGCKSLRSVTIPRGMKAISIGMFYECTSLASVSIPRSVTQIGDSAFSKCSPNLKIQYDGTKAQWNAISGSGKPKTNIQCSDGTL